ncbi:MAG: GAF domain-containing protein [Phycisphaerae bacterium]|nr:GAF domain-containing protein [Phycisphaerae bacterium]
MASIQVIQGPDRGRTFELRDGENIIGRRGRSVALSDGTVSRRHARLNPAGRQWILTDLGSANGTYLNGVRLRKDTAVHRGDQIRCGATLLVFLGGPAGPQATVELDEDGRLVDSATVAQIPSNEDSVIIPTPEAGEKAIDNLRILYELIAEVGSIFNVDVLLRQTLDKIFEFVTADRGYILLIDDDGGLDLRVSRLAGEDSSRDIPISRTMVNEVVRREVGVLSSNAMTDKRFSSHKSVQDYGIRSAICVPIKGRRGVLGIIHVDCSVSEHTYTTEQLRLLTAVGYQTGLAIENVRLYESALQSERLAAIGETVAYLSHHIKNILQAMGAGADVVQAGLDQNNIEKVRKAWPIVQRNLNRINGQILNMLAFSRDREPQLERINVNHIITECIDLVTPRADDRDVALLTDLSDQPPVPLDEAGLNQALLNLITNALDAVEDEPAGAVTVSSRYEPAAREVVIQVIDNGSGIASEQLENIFTPFVSSKGQGGTGLGLAVAKKVVEEHGGTIEVASVEGEGTTFTLNLPAEAEDHGEPDDTDLP